MANYYVSGYTPPSSVTTNAQVKALQQQLNAQGASLRVDGVWGPKTSAAYESGNTSGSAGSSTSSLVPSDYKAYLNEFQNLLKPQPISYTGSSRSDIEAGLRPSYDIAMDNRRKQTGTNKANLDADAAARGMGTSTWVTDVKSREQNAEASDIATLEAGYAQQLMAALQQESANQFAADQFNANAQAQALQSALSLSGSFYDQQLQNTSQGSGGSSSSKSSTASSSATGAVDWDAYLGSLSPAQLQVALYGRDGNQTYINDMKADGVLEQLRKKYAASSGAYGR